MNTLFLRKDETITLGARRGGYAWVLFRERSGVHTLLIRKAMDAASHEGSVYGSVCFLNEKPSERGTGRADNEERGHVDKGDCPGADVLSESYLQAWIEDEEAEGSGF